MARKPGSSNASTRAVSRRDLLRAGGLLVPAAIVAPNFFARTAYAQTTSTFDFYISTTGSDGNPGTLAQPWAITSLRDTNPNNAKIAGKRVGLMAGTYNIAGMGSGSQSGDYQHPALRPPPGTSSASTYIGSCDSSGVYKQRAALIQWGNGNNSPAYGSNVGDGGYIITDGIIFDGGGYNPSGGSASQGVVSFSNNGTYTSAGSVAGVVIKNCEVRNLGQTPTGENEALIFSSGYSGFTVTNCILHNAHKPAQPDHCHGYLEYGNQGSQITYNTIYDCDTGVHAKAGCSGTVVANNYFYNCPTCAVQGMDGAEGNPNSPGTAYSIHHNVIENCGPSHACDINGQAAQGLNWYNNTIYNTQGGSVAALDLRASGNLVKAYNNLVVCTANGSGPYVGTVALSNAGYSVLDYNCYAFNSYSQGWGLSGNSTYDSLSAWQSASHSEAHSIAGNARFVASITVGAGAAQFALAAGSPCIGAGRVGGVSSGAACNLGAWDGIVTQIGASAAAAQGTPDAPKLSVS